MHLNWRSFMCDSFDTFSHSEKAGKWILVCAKKRERKKRLWSHFQKDVFLFLVLFHNLQMVRKTLWAPCWIWHLISSSFKFTTLIRFMLKTESVRWNPYLWCSKDICISQHPEKIEFPPVFRLNLSLTQQWRYYHIWKSLKAFQILKAFNKDLLFFISISDCIWSTNLLEKLLKRIKCKIFFHTNVYIYISKWWYQKHFCYFWKLKCSWASIDR